MQFLMALSLVAVSLGPASNGEPAREPQLAVRGSMVALAYGSGHSIYFRRSDDRGKTFGAPVRVGEGTVVPLTRHRGPRIAFAGSTIVIAAVTGKTAAEVRILHDSDHLFSSETDHSFSRDSDQRSPVKPIAVLL